MNKLIKCFFCKNQIYLPLQEQIQTRELQLVCSRCHSYYCVGSYLNERCESNVSATKTNRKNNKTIYQRNYNLRINNELEQHLPLEFSSTGETEKFLALPGDRLLLIHVIDRDLKRKLIWIGNLTTDRCYQIFSPQRQALAKGWSATLVTGIIFGVALGIFAINRFNVLQTLTFYSTLPFSVGIGAGVYRWQQQRYKLTETKEINRLSSEQQYLKQIQLLQERSLKLKTELSGEQGSLDRLLGLKQKLSTINLPAYGHRIEVLQRAISVIKERLQVGETLLAQYQQLMTIYGIEFDSSILTEELPDLDRDRVSLLDKVRELEKLEEQKEDLSIALQSLHSIDLN
jgi:hypothetical protein